MPTTLYIKNMVCPRCIKVVQEVLEKQNYQVQSIVLGQAVITESEAAIDWAKLQSTLEAEGFALLKDKNQQLIEQVKNLIIDLVQNDRLEDMNLNLSDYLVQQTNKDYHHLSQLFSKHEHITLEKYFIHQKIEKAKELLLYEEMNLNQIAYTLGYNSGAYLSAQFKQITGMNPSEFRKKGLLERKPIDGI